MLKNAGAQFVIIGHSENRANGDTDITINKKINSALKQKLTVIFCIGETLAQKKSKETNLQNDTIKDKIQLNSKYNN